MSDDHTALSEPLTISALGAQGDGLTEAGGQRLFVPFAVPGDRVRVTLGKPRGEGREARIAELCAPGPDRAAPACSHFTTCGGCALQHLRDEAYAAWKVEMVRATLAQAGLVPDETAPLSRTPPGRRRRATFAVRGMGRGRALLGFHEPFSHRIVDLAECPVCDPAITARLPALRAVLGKLLRDGDMLDVTITLGDAGAVDILLTGPLGDRRKGPGASERMDLAEFVSAQSIARLSWQPKPGAEIEPLAAVSPVPVTFADVTVYPPPGSFLQASPEGQRALTEAVLEGVGAARRLVDLFCGCGTFTFPLARTGASVHAVEADRAALATVDQATRRTQHIRITQERRDLFRDPLTANELAVYDAIILDPPRAGAKAQVDEIVKSSVPCIISVSCNPATFARDGAALAGAGYALSKLHIVDQFLWSPHAELVGVFTKERR